MSRIGDKPIQFSSLDVDTDNDYIYLRKDKTTIKLKIINGLRVNLENNQISIKAVNEDNRYIQGMFRTLVNNAVVGLSSSFSVGLDLVGVGYKVEQKANTLVFSLGYSHPVEYTLPEGIVCTIEKLSKQIPQYQTTIIVSGWNKEQVGQVAADLVSLRRPDAYKGKGLRYADRPMTLKPGKSGAKGGKK